VTAPDDLSDALEALRAASDEPRADVDAEAAALAAAVCRDSPGAAQAWATTFGRSADDFESAARAGERYSRRPSPILARLIGEPGAARYARHLAELAMAAASLGELTISALAAATVAGNVQLSAAGVALAAPPPDAAAPAPSRSASDDPSRAPATTDHAARAPVRRPEADEPARSLEQLLAELDALVGLDGVKSEVRHQAQALRIQKLRGAKGLRNPELTRHLVFVGNPGTGKTTTARLVAGIYRAIGLLPKGHLVECDRSELVAGYVGQTALKTAGVIARAIGGALFIDEAYALAGDEYGAEAIETLVKEMEDHRDDLLVIVAGYPDPMDDFIHANPGLESRFRLTLWFEDYSDEQLVEIFGRMAADADFTPSDPAVARLRELLAATCRGEGFGNGRFVRTLFESAVVRQAWRLRDVADPDVAQLRELRDVDLDEAPTPDSPTNDPIADAPATVPGPE
jgi:ATPase family protein associated with various cellular activities (AAA)/AAA lid domain-containing protein